MVGWEKPLTLCSREQEAWMDAETHPGEHRGAGRVLTQGENGQGEAFTHDRGAPWEERGKKSKLSPALDIWKQTLYVASQSQMIKMGIKGALMERKSEAAAMIFSVS